MSDQENKQQGAESVEENTETVKTESAETSVPESGATPPAAVSYTHLTLPTT